MAGVEPRLASPRLALVSTGSPQVLFQASSPPAPRSTEAQEAAPQLPLACKRSSQAAGNSQVPLQGKMRHGESTHIASLQASPPLAASLSGLPRSRVV